MERQETKREQLCGQDTANRMHRLQLGVQIPLSRTLVHGKVMQYELADETRILSRWSLLQEYLGEDLPESN